ncbi:MAG: hypothetical protein AB4372_38400 [Xenococcus sp. (in: cyanobacteria)]
MIEQILKPFSIVLPVLKLLPYLPIRKISITNPSNPRIIAPTQGNKVIRIHGKILNYNRKNPNKVWLINYSHNSKGFFPQNEGGINPNDDGEWEGNVFLIKNDRITIFAIVASDPLLDEICQYYFSAEKFYREQHKPDQKNKGHFLKLPQDILKKCGSIRTSIEVDVA